VKLLLKNLQYLTTHDLEKELKTMADTLSDVSTAQAATDAELTTLEGDEAQEATDVTAIQTKIADLNAQIATLNAEIAAGSAPPDATAQVTAAQAELTRLTAIDTEVKADEAALTA